MTTTSQMYWITRLDMLCDMFVFVFVFVVSMLTALVLAVIGGILRAEYSKGETGWETGRRCHAEMVPICLALAFLFGTLRSFTPTTAEMSAIIVVPKIANSEKVQQAGNKLYDLAIEWMAELKPNKNNKEGANK